MTGEFAGQVALISGGAGSRGRSHSVELVSAERDVALFDVAEQIAQVPWPLAP